MRAGLLLHLMQGRVSQRGLTGSSLSSMRFQITHGPHGQGRAQFVGNVGDEALRICSRLCSRVDVTHHHQAVAIAVVGDGVLRPGY